MTDTPTDAPGTAPRPPVVVPVGLPEYRDTRRHPPIDADAEATAIAEQLARWIDGRVDPWPVQTLDRTATQVNVRLKNLFGSDGSRRSVLVWVGHGDVDANGVTLAVPGGEGNTTDDELAAAALAKHLDQARRRWVRDDATDPPWAVVIIEACRAGAFVRRVASALDAYDGPAGRVVLVGVGDPDGRSLLGVTRDLLELVQWSYSVNDEVDLREWSGRVERRLDEGAVPVPGVVRALGVSGLVLRRPGLRVAAGVDVYSQLAPLLERLSRDERTHFARKGMGADFGELAWHFVGREVELARIAVWLRNTRSGLLTVTGRAGTGKSAVLGNLVLRSHPSLRAALAEAGLLPAEDDIGNVPPFDISLHLRGTGVLDVADALLRASGLPAVERSRDVGVRDESSLAGDAVDALARRASAGDGAVGVPGGGGPWLSVLADGLDEARDPLRVAGLLRDVAAVPGCRVVVGTRASTSEGPDRPVPSDTDLLDALAPATDDRHTLERSPETLRTYVRQRLSGVDPLAAAFVADAVADGQDRAGRPREFLFARLVVHEVLDDPTLASSRRRDQLAKLLAGDHRDIFGHALARLAAAAPATVSLLEALSTARGRGLPRADGLWASVATALSGRPVGERPVGERDVDRALADAAPYLLLDGEDGQTVYRLAHYTFVEHFTGAAHHTERQVTAALALMDAAARTDVADPLNPYLARYLAAHTAAAGDRGWAALADQEQVLDRLDPARVADAVAAAEASGAPAAIRAVVAFAGPLAAVPAAERLGPRRLAMATQGVQAFPAAPRGALWSPWISVRQPVTVHRVLTGHTGAVTGVAVFTGADGRPRLSTTSHDGTVRVWHPDTGRPDSPTLTGHTGAVTGAAVFTGADGRPRLATTGWDLTVRVWDPDTGRPDGPTLTGHTRPLTAIAAFTGADGRPRLATTSQDKMIRVWDPSTGKQVRRRWGRGLTLTGHTDALTAVAAFPGADGRPRLATTSHDKTIRVWDPDTGRPEGPTLTGHTGAVTAVAAFTGPDGRPRLATTSHDGTVRVWDPDTGRPEGPTLTGHTGAVTAVAAFTGPDGRPRLATTSHDGTVRVWDPDTGRPEGPTLTGHTGAVTAVAAFTGADGRPRLATTSHDWTVRVWDPDTGRPDGPTLTGHARPLTAVAVFTGADGRPRLATTSHDWTVRVWDPDTGRPDSPTLTGHSNTVTGVAVFTGPDGRPRLATTGWDLAVRVWDPDTGRPDGPTLTGHTRPLTAIAAFTGADGRPRLATTSHDKTIRVWDPSTGKQVRRRWGRRLTLTGHTDALTAVAAFPGADGRPRLATTSHDGTVRVWDPDTGRPDSPTLTGHTGPVTAVAAFTGADGRPRLATTSHDWTVRVWDPDTGRPDSPTLTGHTLGVTAVAAFPGPDGRPRLATTSHDRTVRVWDPGTGRCDHFLHLGVTGCAVTAVDDGLVIALEDGWTRLRLLWPMAPAARPADPPR